MKRKLKVEYVLVGVFVSINIFVIFELLFNMQFFYLDNPKILLDGKKTFFDVVFEKNIRLNLSYNICTYIASRLFGNVPKAYYFIQWFLWELILLSIWKWVSNYTDSLKTKLFIIFIAMLISPTAENLFTIGKQEIHLSLGILIVILCTYYLFFDFQLNNKKLLLGILMFGNLFSLTSKETSMILYVWGFLIFFYVFIFRRQYKNYLLLYGVVWLILTGLLFVYKSNFIINSSYTSVELDILSCLNNLIYYFKYNLDVCALGILGLLYGIVEWINDKKNSNIHFALIVNICGWGYFFGICLWRWPLSYYLYPAGMIFVIAICVGVMYSNPKYKKIMAICCAVLTVYSINYNYRVAVSHVNLGKTYSESINEVLKMKIEGKRILLENYSFFEEPVIQTAGLLNNYYDRGTEVVGVYQWLFPGSVNNDALELYGRTEEELLQYTECFQPGPGDYILKYVRDVDFYGPIRGVNPYNSLNYDSQIAKCGYHLQLINSSENINRYLTIKDRQIFNKIISGYALYQIIDDTAPIIDGLYEDNWTGKELKFKNYCYGEGYTIHIDYSLADENCIEIWIDDQLFTQKEVRAGDTIVVDELLETAGGYIKADVSFYIEKVVVPNEDLRELGVHITLNTTKE